MGEKMNRPGGKLASRPLHFFWIVDCSGSMSGEKIGTVNHAIQSVIPEMLDAAEDNPNAQLMIRALRFATGASWMTEESIPIEDFVWDDLVANGVTDLGEALNLVCEQLSMPPMSERALPPVLVLLSDGHPTDNYKVALDRLLHMPWGRKSVRIAISIGSDADDNILAEFTGTKELVLQANDAASLTKMIKWASTAASVVSAPVSRPVVQQSPEISVKKEKSYNPIVAELNDLLPSDNADNDGPLVIDMVNIPNPDDDGDVW